MTFPNANRPPLICIPSFNRAPCAPLRLHRSLPARSTQWIFDLTTAMCDEALTSPLESSTKCLLLSTVSVKSRGFWKSGRSASSPPSLSKLHLAPTT